MKRRTIVNLFTIFKNSDWIREFKVVFHRANTREGLRGIAGKGCTTPVSKQAARNKAERKNKMRTKPKTERESEHAFYSLAPD